MAGKYRNELIKGYGSRKNRVHIFDIHGSYITRGFIRNNILFTQLLIGLNKFTVRRFTRREVR